MTKKRKAKKKSEHQPWIEELIITQQPTPNGRAQRAGKKSGFALSV
jgi:hypothetical protein